jgi:hypothetical protein
MTKTRKFKSSLPRNRQKKPKIRRSSDKRKIPTNPNHLTNENTPNQRIQNKNQCFTSHPNDPNDFKLKEEEDISKSFTFFEDAINEKENNFFDFTGDDPTNIPSNSINIDVNDSLFENDKISESH